MLKRISKSAIDKAGNILAKEKFQTYRMGVFGCNI